MAAEFCLRVTDTDVERAYTTTEKMVRKVENPVQNPVRQPAADRRPGPQPESTNSGNARDAGTLRDDAGPCAAEFVASMGADGFEPPAKSSGKTAVSRTGAAKSAASGGDSGTGTAAEAGAGATAPQAPDTPAEAAPTADAGRPGAGPDGTLADVLRMLDRLPLTDAERADAVRRLLADQAAAAKPR